VNSSFTEEKTGINYISDATFIDIRHGSSEAFLKETATVTT